MAVLAILGESRSESHSSSPSFHPRVHTPAAHRNDDPHARFADDLYIKAVSEFILDRHESALIQLRRLLSFSSGYEANLLAAKCYQAMVRADSAVVFVQRALSINDT
jgi:hypothetical protein